MTPLLPPKPTTRSVALVTDARIREAIVELYGHAPGDFVAARNATVRELRAAGARDVAAEVARLRRPSVQQWALNSTARTRPDIVDSWAEAAAVVRAAHEAATSGKSTDLRGALAALRERTSVLIGVAGQWTKTDELGPALSEIAASASATEALRSGVLGAGDAGSVATNDSDDQHTTRPRTAATRGRSAPTADVRGQRVEKAKASWERAVTQLDQANAAAEVAAQRHDEAAAKLNVAASATEAARRQLADAEAAQATAERELQEARRDRTAADRLRERAQRANDAALERLDGLTPTS